MYHHVFDRNIKMRLLYYVRTYARTKKSLFYANNICLCTVCTYVRTYVILETSLSTSVDVNAYVSKESNKLT